MARYNALLAQERVLSLRVLVSMLPITEARNIKKDRDKKTKLTGQQALPAAIMRPVKAAPRIKMPSKSGYIHFLWYRKVYEDTTTKIA